MSDPVTPFNILRRARTQLLSDPDMPYWQRVYLGGYLWRALTYVYNQKEPA